MAVVRGGFAVQRWVQAFADEADRVTGIHSFGTYRNHGASKSDPDGDPSINVDCFVSPDRRDIGDAFCEWAMANYRRLGVDYIIYQRRIWNPEISPNWRPYNGASPHTDHVHVSFNPSAPPDQGDLSMADAASIEQLIHSVKGHLESVSNNGTNLVLQRFDALGPIVTEILKASRDDAEVDAEALAAELSKTLGPAVAKAVGQALVNG